MSRNCLAGLTGLGIGAVLGLLFAPRSGIRTRVLIAKKTRDGAEELKNKAEALRDRAASMIERGEQEALRHKDALVRAVETGARAYRQAVG